MPETPQRIDLPSGTTLYFREGNHSYWKQADERTGKCSGRIPGFSTIGKALDTNADPLITWGAKLEAQGICELLSAVPPDDLASYLTDGEQLHRDLIAAELDWRSVRDRRAQQGTTIHEKVFAALARGQRPSLANVAEDERPYGQAAFRFWMDHSPEPLAVEQVVYSAEWDVAGRFDLLARVDGTVILYDAKTTKAPENGRERFVNVGHHVQLAGYVYAAAESGFEVPEGAALVYLMDDGTYEVEDCVASWDHFTAAFAAYNASKAVGKRAREQRKQMVAA